MLLTIFSFAFFFRVAIIFHNEYPPSSDIGLHGSIINLILDDGNLPIENPYHMGGEPLATPPGFHFFVSILILLTGMPLILAQLITAAFFSSVIVFPAYLVSRRIWRNQSAGILAAFFAAVSALSLEMISWGGYTNIVSLALIVIIFYLFLRNIDQPSHLHLLIGTLLFGGLIITHTFSLFVFFPILVFYFFLLLIGKFLKLKVTELVKKFRFFAVSFTLGIVVVSPWLLRVFSFYIGASSEGALTGGLDNRNIILANRTVEPIILALIIVLIPTFFLLKTSRKRYVDGESMLLVAWFLVPIVMTQAYLFGVFTDYSRFMYFIDFPGILIISAGLFYLFRYASIAISKVPRIKWNRIKKTVPALIFTVSIFFFIILSPWSIFSDEAMERANYYTTIQQPENTTIAWIRNNTPPNNSTVLVADHLYGWWLSGIGERTTLSAADLEFLIYSHELEVAKNAAFLLDTNYYIDDGLIQVRDDGPYLRRYSPSFSIETWGWESYSLFNFKDNGTQFEYYWINNDGKRVYENTTLADMKLIGTPISSKTKNSSNLTGTNLTVTFENDFFTVEKTLTVQETIGFGFAELSYDIEVKRGWTNIFKIWLPVFTNEGIVFTYNSTQMFGFYAPFERVCGLVIFKGDTPVDSSQVEDPNRVEQIYVDPWKRNINIKILVGVFDAEDLSYNQVKETYYNLAKYTPVKKENDDPLINWDYVEMMQENPPGYDVSYVICRDPEIYPKFSEDPKFRLVFNAGNVAVFQVVK